MMRGGHTDDYSLKTRAKLNKHLLVLVLNRDEKRVQPTDRKTRPIVMEIELFAGQLGRIQLSPDLSFRRGLLSAFWSSGRQIFVVE